MTADIPNLAAALTDLATEIETVNREHGWYDDDRTFGDDIALLHSELSEALEAWRANGFNDRTACRECGGKSCKGVKPEGVGSELADVLIRLVDTASRRGIDLASETARKVAYNATRPYRHGGKAL